MVYRIYGVHSEMENFYVGLLVEKNNCHILISFDFDIETYKILSHKGTWISAAKMSF